MLQLDEDVRICFLSDFFYFHKKLRSIIAKIWSSDDSVKQSAVEVFLSSIECFEHAVYIKKRL